MQVEGIIRDDFTVEGYEILELLCELVAERAVSVQRPVSILGIQELMMLTVICVLVCVVCE